MANEISYQAQLSLRNGTLTDQFASGSKSANQTTQALFRNVQTIGTGIGGDAMDMGSLSVPGFMAIQNLDLTNSVDIGYPYLGVFYGGVRILAGEVYMWRWSTAALTTPYAKANVAPVKIFYIIYEA